MSHVVISVVWLFAIAVMAAFITFFIVRHIRNNQASRDPEQTSNRPHEKIDVPDDDDRENPKSVAADHIAAKLKTATSWGYQLQDFNPAHAERSTFDVLVIDPTLDGDDESALSPNQIDRLKRKPDGARRIVLAYLSIGEAESYRSYWHKKWKKKKPAWLLGENPDWEENYAVRFWHHDWKKIIFGDNNACLDKILAQGFDGVYLDKCDVYEDLQRRYKSIAKSRKNLPADMISFIETFARYANAHSPGFRIVMQNAEGLLRHSRLRRILSGVAKEELVFGQDGNEIRNQDDDYQFSRHHLELARKDGLPVFVIEYLNDKGKITEAAKITHSLGYVLTISDPNRDLASLGSIPHPLPEHTAAYQS